MSVTRAGRQGGEAASNRAAAGGAAIFRLAAVAAGGEVFEAVEAAGAAPVPCA